MKYGALRTKVLSMYGRLLSREELMRLCQCRSVGEVCAFLKGRGDWEQYLSDLSISASAAELKKAVGRRLYAEYQRIYSFSYYQDRMLLRFLIYRSEYELIKGALRRLCTRGGKSELEVAEFIKTHGSVDVEELSSCTDFAGLLHAIEGSIFEKPMAVLPRDEETGLPDYKDACILLENTYYSYAFSYLTKKGGGADSKRQRELLGFEADLLNIISLARLRRHFKGSLPSAWQLLIPINGKLRPELLKALISANGEAEFSALVQKSPYGKYFADAGAYDLESAYENAMESFCRKLVRSPRPGLCTAQAYLTLRELECDTIQRIIEAISCGADPVRAL